MYDDLVGRRHWGPTPLTGAVSSGGGSSWSRRGLHCGPLRSGPATVGKPVLDPKHRSDPRARSHRRNV
eukprot:2256168-Prymnesium_polylepis.1